MATIHDPLTLPCGQTLPNRIMKSALSEALADRANSPTDELLELYSRWAGGGYGLIVTGNVMIDRCQLGEPGNVVIEDDRDRESLTRWAKITQEKGAAAWMQINHPGRQANALPTGRRPVAPSAIATKIPGAARPRELRHDEILDIVRRFGTTAQVAERAGFNGVQVHGAHGYLVAQFLSPLANRRTDQWGGDAEHRMRFVVDVIREIRSRVGSGFGVGIKLNSADFQRGGFSEEDSQDVVHSLVTEGVDLIEISGGSYEAPAMMGALADSTRQREAYFLEYARTVRKLAQDVPLAVTGGFRSAQAIETAVASGDCDLVGLGRPTCIAPEAAALVLEDGSTRLPSSHIKVGARSLLGKVTDVRTIDSALDLQWHTDQLHRMGNGSDPDTRRPWWRTAGSALNRNGWKAFTRKRS